MTKTLSAVALALALGAAPVAFAQTPPHGTANRVEPYGTTNRAVEEVIQSDQIRASKMIGSAMTFKTGKSARCATWFWTAAGRSRRW